MTGQNLQKQSYQVSPHPSKYHYMHPKTGRTVQAKAAQFCQNWLKLAARTAARTGQFWLPEQEPELPSSGSQKQQPELLFWPELCCQNWQHSSAEPGTSGRYHSQNCHSGCAYVSAMHQKKNLAVQEIQGICSQDYTESIQKYIYMVKPVRI